MSLIMAYAEITDAELADLRALEDPSAIADAVFEREGREHDTDLDKFWEPLYFQLTGLTVDTLDPNHPLTLPVFGLREICEDPYIAALTSTEVQTALERLTAPGVREQVADVNPEAHRTSGMGLQVTDEDLAEMGSDLVGEYDRLVTFYRAIADKGSGALAYMN